MAKLIHISKGIAKEKGIPVWFVATTLKETGKAIYLYGHGTTETKAMGICCNCGRTLTHPVSVLLGIGPECGQHFHDWNAVGGYTEENIERLKQAVRSITIDTWVPKTCILEVQETEDTVNVPKNHHMLNGKTNGPTKKQAILAKTIKGNERIKISFPFDRATLEQVKTLSGRKYHSEGKFWSCPVTFEAVEQLKEWGFEIGEILTKKLEDKKVNVKDVETDTEIPGLKGTLYPFQKQGVAFIEKRNGRALIGDEMGLGKTVQVLAWLQLRKDIRPVIIVTPANAKLVWRNHIRDWMSDYGKVEVLNGTKAENINADIVIINYDILPHWLDELKKMEPKCVVADECHYFKNNKAQRTKAIKKLVSNVPHFIPVSGTFITNRPAEGFNAINLVEPTLFNSFFKYAMKYCNARHNGFGWDFTGASNTQELHNILTNTMMIRRLKADVLTELPDKIRAFVPLEITTKDEYQKAEAQFIEWLKENKGEMTAARAEKAETLVKIESLKQLCIRGKIKQAIQWIRDFLDSDGKLVVFAIHKETITALMNEFKNVAVKIDGSTPQDKRTEVAKQFQTDEKTRLFIGNVQAAGIAITLTAASSVAFVELPWTPGELTQAEDRCHRIGQKNAVNVYYLISENTIEEKIATLLDKKRKVLDSVLDGRETEEETLFSELIKNYNKEGDNK